MIDFCCDDLGAVHPVAAEHPSFGLEMPYLHFDSVISWLFLVLRGLPGRCPYASSFFVARDRGFMDLLGDGAYVYTDDDLQFGVIARLPVHARELAGDARRCRSAGRFRLAWPPPGSGATLRAYRHSKL